MFANTTNNSSILKSSITQDQGTVSLKQTPCFDLLFYNVPLLVFPTHVRFFATFTTHNC